MKRLLASCLALGALGACAGIQPVHAPGPLSSGASATTPLGWARLADLQDSLAGQSPAQEINAYLAGADAAEKAGDKGAAVLCLEAAFRLSFRQAGVQRWVQEEQRAKLARRLQAIKAGQGRKGAAAAYGAIAALSEAYLDGGQADDDKKAYQEAQARIAAAQKAKEQADAQAMGNLLSNVMGNALQAGMGGLSEQQATLNMLQGELDYIDADAKNTEAAKGLDEAQAVLDKGTLREVEDRASRLLAANLAGTADSAPYAKGVQAELRKSGLGDNGAIAAFLALAPPDRSRSSKKDFVQAFQAAEKALWKADLRGEPLPLASVKPEALGGAWDAPQKFQRFVGFIQYASEGSYNRVISFDSTASGASLKKNVSISAQVAVGRAIEGGFEVLPYPGAGFHLINTVGISFADLTFPGDPLLSTGSTWAINDRLGFGSYIPFDGGGNFGLALGASTRLFTFGGSDMAWKASGPIKAGGYSSIDFRILGLELEGSLRLFGCLKLGVSLPVAAPLGTDEKSDAGGARVLAGLVFNFSSEPPAKSLAAAQSPEPRQEP